MVNCQYLESYTGRNVMFVLMISFPPWDPPGFLYAFTPHSLLVELQLHITSKVVKYRVFHICQVPLLSLCSLCCLQNQSCPGLHFCVVPRANPAIPQVCSPVQDPLPHFKWSAITPGLYVSVLHHYVSHKIMASAYEVKQQWNKLSIDTWPIRKLLFQQQQVNQSRRQFTEMFRQRRTGNLQYQGIVQSVSTLWPVISTGYSRSQDMWEQGRLVLNTPNATNVGCWPCLVGRSVMGAVISRMSYMKYEWNNSIFWGYGKEQWRCLFKKQSFAIQMKVNGDIVSINFMV